jgi:oxygen-independent coproporphyrinogen-3 oxidase
MAFGVYIHFPYCLSKCPYCDFATVVTREIPHRRYARAVCAELRARAAGPREVTSIYFGGGTPSLWETGALGAVLAEVRRLFEVAPDAEITLEANPGASDTTHFSELRALGVNRLSIGVQSLDAATLRELGRSHSPDDARAAVAAARAAGFGNLSLDLLFGATGQTAEGARRDAEEVAALAPEHVSAYALTLDVLAEEVPMAREVRTGLRVVPGSDAQAEMGEAVREELRARGYERYEVSNYARGRAVRARHNTLYWTGGEVLAAGVGAYGFVRNGESARRYGNHRSPQRYLEEVEAGLLPESFAEPLTADTLVAERIFCGLRLSDGVDFAEVEREFGPGIAAAREREMEWLSARGLLRREGTRIWLTERGLDFHSECSARLM